MDQDADVSDISDIDIVSETSREQLEEKPFDFEKFCSYMKNSLLGNSNVSDDADFESATEDVDLKNYLLAYEQLHNFFLLLGAAFQFVALDVKSKIKILKSYQENVNENGKLDSTKHFATVKSMVEYEEKNQLLSNHKYLSGCRTLLRLHRGLDFVRKFLGEVYRLENDMKLCTVAREVYNQTLAKYHSWVVRNAARMAMQFLPSRLELLQRISCHSEEKLSQVLHLFPEAIDAMDNVYDRVQNIYSVNNLLDLP